jgi:hypothetical protein
MNLAFMVAGSESRNQSGFSRVYERELWRVSASSGKYWRIVLTLAGLLTVSLIVAFPTFVYPNKTKLKSLEAEVGIEHQSVMFQNLRNSQQHKPLRPFLNVFKRLIRVP